MLCYVFNTHAHVRTSIFICKFIITHLLIPCSQRPTLSIQLFKGFGFVDFGDADFPRVVEDENEDEEDKHIPEEEEYHASSPPGEEDDVQDHNVPEMPISVFDDAVLDRLQAPIDLLAKQSCVDIRNAQSTARVAEYLRDPVGHEVSLIQDGYRVCSRLSLV